LELGTPTIVLLAATLCTVFSNEVAAIIPHFQFSLQV